jgi:hypothetical protein
VYSRRHLATASNGGWRDLKYVAEFYELEQTIWKTLDRIRKRDGVKILREVADLLVDSVAASVDEKQGGRSRRARLADSRSAAHWGTFP